MPKCVHLFHTKCITTWLQHHDVCPICRGNVKEGVQSLVAQEDQLGAEHQLNSEPQDLISPHFILEPLLAEPPDFGGNGDVGPPPI